MHSPAGSTLSQLMVGSAPRKIKPGLSTTYGRPSIQVLVQSTHGCAARGRLCQSAVPTHHTCTASQRCQHPALTHATPRHATPRHATSSCPQPRPNFRPTRQPKSPDFSCAPQANIAPPRWIWQGSTPTQRQLAAALLRGQGQHPWVDRGGQRHPECHLKTSHRGDPGIPALGRCGRSRGAPGSVGCQSRRNACGNCSSAATGKSGWCLMDSS